MMELSIQKYCYINPKKITINGEESFDLTEETLDKSLVQAYNLLGLNYLKFFKMDSLSKLAILATEALLKETTFYSPNEKKDVSVILANASSSVVTDRNYQETINDPANYFPSPSLFVYTLPNICIGEICIKHKIYGENVFLIHQQFDAATLHFYVNELFEKQKTQHCITGWIESNPDSFEAFLLLAGTEKSSHAFDITTIENMYKINKR
jgi:hypothetical protein